MGRSICHNLAGRENAIAVVDSNGEAAETVAKELRENGAHAVACRADVSDRAQVDDAMRTVRSELGPVGILVTSAGVAKFEPFADITLESWNRVLAINLTGTFHCVQAALPDMVDAKWGRVVLISSSSAHHGQQHRTLEYRHPHGGPVASFRSYRFL